MPDDDSLRVSKHKNRAAQYRDKAEEARTMAETMSNNSARRTVLEVAETWDRLADEEENKRPSASN